MSEALIPSNVTETITLEPDFHFISHVLLHWILHYWATISLNPFYNMSLHIPTYGTSPGIGGTQYRPQNIFLILIN